MTKFFQSHTKPVVIAIAAALMIIGAMTLSDALAQVKSSAATDASKPTSVPATKVVGWRGDGTGRYPDATPPTEWSVKESGPSKNLLWKTKLPCWSWATPIIVGDKIIVRSDPYDLICLDKNTGKPLWIRSHPPVMTASDADKKANPALKEIEPLVADLQKLNDEFVAKGWSAELYKRKHDLQKKINDLSAKADEKYTLFPDRWCESWSGYTAQTPCSDGKWIYICSGCGVSAAYDLDGNLKWSWYGQIPAIWAGEHGRYTSPGLIGNKFLISEYGVVFDKNTGKELWREQITGDRCDQYAIIPFTVNGKEFALWHGNFVRLTADCKSFCMVPFASSAPLIQDNTVFFHAGSGMGWFSMEAAPNDELKVTCLTKEFPYERMGLPKPEGTVNTNFSNYSFWVPAPLYHEGLLYRLSSWGMLAVYDVAKKTEVYHKTLPFDYKNPMHRKTFGCGIGASPALAGKYIYLTDNAGCTLVIEPGREYKQVAKNNIDYIMPHGWETNYWIDGYHEITLSTPIFDGSRIYVRGEQFLYCVGEK